MKKNLIVGLLFVSLLLYSGGLFDNFDKKKKMIQDSFSKKYGKERAAKLTKVYDALLAFKLPIDTLKLSLSQVLHETGVFMGKQRASDYNNFSGIKYSGSKEQLLSGAYKSPVSVIYNGKKSFYAGYQTPLNWAKDYIRIISMGKQPPIKAVNTEDFAVRLKNNKYYEDDVKNYSKNLNFFYNFLTSSGI